MDSGTDSVYRPPESQLETQRDRAAQSGSIDRALRGEIDFGIQEVISEAWALVSGSKGVIIGFAVLALVINVCAQFAVTLLTGGGESDDPFANIGTNFGSGLVAGLAVAPVNAALFLYAIKRAAGDPEASFDTLSESLQMLGPVLAVSAVSTIAIYLGFLFLLLPGVYLAVAYTFALPLVIERKLGYWEAMETSRRAVTRCWFRIFGLMFVMSLIVGLGSVITLGIGLIWLGPMFILGIAVAYRRLFGYAGPAV